MVLIMSVLIVNKENFNSVRTNEKPVLLDFYADWCGPCSMVSPIIDKIAEENPQYVVGKINVDSEQELARTFKVFSIPTLIVMKNGEVASRSVGAKSKSEILAMLES
jgi:thioredoxin 1